MRIETDRLIIRNFKQTDKQDLCEYMLQRVDKEFECYSNFTEEKAQNEINFRCKSDEFFAVVLKSENKVVGNIYLGKRDFNTKELGYVLNENYHRMGIATECCKAVIDYLFKNGVHRIYSETCPANKASWKTMKKIGMKREAVLKQNVSFKNDTEGKPIFWDTYIYAVLNPYK